MPNSTGRAANDSPPTAPEVVSQDSDRALKNFRYVVGSVNESAQAVWAELWREFQQQVTPGGMVTPQLDRGFAPACGWAEFLEKLWLLKHYLDCIHHLARD